MAGIPVITTRYRSIPELVTDGVNGLLIEPSSSQALAKAIHQIASDPELLKRLAEGSWQARRRYDAARVVPELLSLMGRRRRISP